MRAIKIDQNKKEQMPQDITVSENGNLVYTDFF